MMRARCFRGRDDYSIVPGKVVGVCWGNTDRDRDSDGDRDRDRDRHASTQARRHASTNACLLYTSPSPRD
eukprot:1185351-Alexandrium_andersonii.AAC.1